MDSWLVRKLRQGIRAYTVLDLDGTYAAGSIEARRRIRALLESTSVFIFSTARSPEMVMSRAEYDASVRLGFARPAPRWLKGPDGLYVEACADEVSQHECCYDPDVILAFGQGIYLRQVSGGYLVDDNYETFYLANTVKGGEVAWRDEALALVRRLALEHALAAIELKDNYDKREADVAPLSYRIQLDFFGELAIDRKYKAMRSFADLPKDEVTVEFELVDESKPDTPDPADRRGTLYVMPAAARKEDMLNHILVQGCRHADIVKAAPVVPATVYQSQPGGEVTALVATPVLTLSPPEMIDTSQVFVTIAGDTLTDFRQMCEAGHKARVTGVIVGDRLVKCIVEKANFAAVDLQHFHDALEPAPEGEGYYTWKPKEATDATDDPAHERMIILGNKAWPGTDGADTILEYLQKFRPELFVEAPQLSSASAA